jgi:hypothetical protein
VQVFPVHGDWDDGCPETARNHAAQKRAEADVHGGDLDLIVGQPGQENIRHPSKPSICEVDNLCVQHVPAQEQLLIVQGKTAVDPVLSHCGTANSQPQLTFVEPFRDRPRGEISDTAAARTDREPVNHRVLVG